MKFVHSFWHKKQPTETASLRCVPLTETAIPVTDTKVKQVPEQKQHHCGPPSCGNPRIFAKMGAPVFEGTHFWLPLKESWKESRNFVWGGVPPTKTHPNDSFQPWLVSTPDPSQIPRSGLRVHPPACRQTHAALDASRGPYWAEGAGGFLRTSFLALG